MNATHRTNRLDAAFDEVEARLLAQIDMFERRMSRMIATFWLATLATIVALLKL